MDVTKSVKIECIQYFGIRNEAAYRFKVCLHTKTTRMILTSWNKARPYQQQCRGNIVESYKVECCKNGNNVERVFRKISSFRQSGNKLNMFNSLKLLKNIPLLEPKN